MGVDGSLLFDTGVNTRGVEKGLQEIEKIAEGYSVGKNIFSNLATDAIQAAGGTLKNAAQTGIDFEASMSKVRAVSGATAQELEDLTALARDYGASTVFSSSECADALNYMAMAGWNVEQMTNGLPGILNLAASAGEDLGTTSDIVTDALTAFGMKAEESAHFADILAIASNKSNTNVSMMGDTFKYVAPVAGALGYSAEDVAVAVGLMANSGIKASQAGTSLRAILSNLTEPTDKQAAAMETLGISLTDSEGNMKTLDQVMQDMRGSFTDLSEAEQASYASIIAGQEGMSGLLAILNASDTDFTNLKNAIYDCDGACDSMAKTMTDNVDGELKELESMAEELQLTLYDMFQPMLKDAIPEVQDAVEWITDNLDEIVAFAKPVAAALAAVFAVNQVTKFSKAVIGMVKGIGVAMKTNPLGLLLTAIEAVAIAASIVDGCFEAWNAHLDEVRDNAAKLPDEVEEIKNTVSEAAEEWDKMKDSSESAISDAEFDYSNIQNLKDQLSDLVNADGTIKDGCETEVSNIIDKINGYTDACYEVSDGLILKNDEVIGSYQNLSSGLDALIEKTHAMAVINAYQDDYETAVSGTNDTQYAMITAQEQIDSLIPQLQDAERKLVELKALSDANPLNMAIKNAYSESVAYAEGLREQIDTEYGLLTDAARLNAEYQSVISNYDNAYDAYLKDDLEGMQRYGAALQNGIVNAVSEEDILAIEDNIERLTKLKERAETLYEANPTDENADMLNEAKEALAAQQAEQEEYYELFGAQGAEYAHALEDGFTEALQWDTTSEAMMNAMMGSLTYETEKQFPHIEGIADTIEEPFAGLPDSMFVDGANAGQGLADGMLSKADEVAAASNSLAYIAENGFTGPLDIRSPSRVMTEAAAFAGEGVVVGLDKSIPLVASASQNLAQSLVSGFDGISFDMADAAVAGTLSIMNAQGASLVGAYSPVYREAYTSQPEPVPAVSGHSGGSQSASPPNVTIYIGDEEIRGFIVSAVADENANSGGWSI